ncbi:hypothetical protein DOM21_03705 [Bacteriovorax stolpii]|nr:hypothetical protein DOM21_03705 [Bacteriovorax stolpii]
MQHILEAIVQILLVGTGSFIRWLIFKKKESFIVFFKTKSNYWNDLFIGALFWTILSVGGYYAYIFFKNA